VKIRQERLAELGCEEKVACTNQSFGERAEQEHQEHKGATVIAQQALVSWVLFEGALAGSVTRWPLRGREK
jgi:hypothetical protein